MQDKELKNRVRAFTGAFVVMVSPVLLAIVLKKVNLTAAGKYQGIQMLEALVDLVQRSFAHLAAVTLVMGILPFLCMMASEASADYVAPRLKAATKVLLFVANVLLMLLGSGILLLFHKNVPLVAILCSAMVTGVVAVNIVLTMVIWSQDDAAETHSELEHLLEFSSSVTAMMFLVLECVVLEGLLKNSLGQTAPAPSAAQGQETFLGGSLLISFITTAFGVSLMNVWCVFSTALRLLVPDSPKDQEKGADGAENRGSKKSLASTLPWCLNFIIHAIPVVAVLVLITWEVLPHKWKPAVWLPFLPPIIVLLLFLARSTCEKVERKPMEDKPASLELTKAAFTGFLAVAVPSATNNASVGNPSIVFFVLFTAATVLMGLVWRLLTTHEDEARRPSYVLNAAKHASFGTHLLILIAGVAFWVMAVNV